MAVATDNSRRQRARPGHAVRPPSSQSNLNHISRRHTLQTDGTMLTRPSDPTSTGTASIYTAHRAVLDSVNSAAIICLRRAIRILLLLAETCLRMTAGHLTHCQRRVPSNCKRRIKIQHETRGIIKADKTTRVQYFKRLGLYMYIMHSKFCQRR